MSAGAPSSRAWGQTRLLELVMALILLLNFVVLVGAVTIVYRHHDAWMRASQPLQHTGPMPPPHAAVPAAGQ